MTAETEGANQLAHFPTGGMTLHGLDNPLIYDALRQSRGNVSAAARLLGLSRAQFAYRLGMAGREPAV